MGRRPDPPGLQEAKGNPGRRSKAVKAREAQAARVAEMLGNAASADLAMPPLLTDPLFAPALAVWKEIGPELARTSRAPKESRLILAMLCVYIAEWMAATVDIATNGQFQSVPTVSGGHMERVRPIVQFREVAMGNIRHLSAEFGLTPAEMFSLFKDQAAAAQANPGLFDAPGAQRQAAQAVAEDDAPPARTSVVGSAARLRGAPPPGTLPN